MNETNRWSEMLDVLADIGNHLAKEKGPKVVEIESLVCGKCGNKAEYRLKGDVNTTISGSILCSTCAMKAQLKYSK